MQGTSYLYYLVKKPNNRLCEHLKLVGIICKWQPVEVKAPLQVSLLGDETMVWIGCEYVMSQLRRVNL